MVVAPEGEAMVEETLAAATREAEDALEVDNRHTITAIQTRNHHFFPTQGMTFPSHVLIFTYNLPDQHQSTSTQCRVNSLL